MQVLKEDVRNRIIDSALNVFYEKGFKGAKMEDIASGAGIPTGLIYSYFKNKGDLFNRITLPALRFMRDVIHDERISDVLEDNLFGRELPAMLTGLEKYHREIVILVDKSEGSSLWGVKKEIIDAVTVHIKSVPSFFQCNFEDIFYHVLSTNFLEGILEIARHYQGREWAKSILDLLIRQYLYGVSAFRK